MKIILSTIFVLFISQIYCKYETPPGYGNSEQSKDSDEESKDDLNFDMDMSDIPDMNFIEKVKVKKAEPSTNDFYMKSPGYMDSDRLLSRSPVFGKNHLPRFRFSQTNSPIDNEYLNQLSGSTDPLKPALHYEQVRKQGTSNGVLLNNKRRTVNFETGDYPEMFSELRKD